MVHATRGNADQVVAALSAYGAPLGDATAEDFAKAGTIFQIGVPPLRIDLLTSIDGLDFGHAWPNRFEAQFGDVPALVLSKSDLIKNKRAAGRLQDLADADALEAFS